MIPRADLNRAKAAAGRLNASLSLGLVLLSLLLSQTTHAVDQRDPWESFNRRVFVFNERLDEWFLRPVAVVYRDVMPGFADKAVTSFFRNLSDVPTLANQILQLKHREAAITSSRLMFNTTWGLLGLIDVATMMELEVQQEDFGQTLNFYGVPQGPYLMLPFFGPATVTEAIGDVADSQVSVFSRVGEPENYLAYGLRVVDIRADVIPAENLVVGDRYVFVRNAYLQARDFLINDGKVVDDPFLDDDFDDF